MELHKNITLSSRDKIQSRYLGLTAAGSTGTDGSTEGVHLQWMLGDTLGARHLPKGNYANAISSDGFTKPDDYVKVYRVRREDARYPFYVDLEQDSPVETRLSNNSRIWIFTPSKGAPGYAGVRFIVQFDDHLAYDRAAKSSTIDGTTTLLKDPVNSLERIEILKAYKGVVSVQVTDEQEEQVFPFFSAEFMMNRTPEGNGTLRVEAISNDEVENREFLSLRKTFSTTLSAFPENQPAIDNTILVQPQDVDLFEVMNSDLTSIRFDYSGGTSPAKIGIETYQGVITNVSRSDSGWTPVGEEAGFALNINKDIVYNRLDNSTLNVGGNWPRYIGKVVEGPAGLDVVYGVDKYTVDTKVYLNRWDSVGGLYQSVDKYLSLSSDPSQWQAIEQNEGEAPLSHLQGLQMSMLDFHNARMLGMGTIDTEPAGDDTEYLYLALYTTYADLDGVDEEIKKLGYIPGMFTGKMAGITDMLIGNSKVQDIKNGRYKSTHYRMTLPISRNNEKLPKAPKIADLSYGSQSKEDLQIPENITDELGYFRNGLRRRMVNINVEFLDEEELSLQPFFETAAEFLYEPESDPVAFGIEHRTGIENGQTGLVDWEKTFTLPKLHEDRFTGEVVPYLNRGENPIFVHDQSEAGWHEYRLYAINIFGRPSEISIGKATKTSFKEVNHMLPPVLASKYIFEEEVPMVTSSEDQEELKKLDPEGDTTLIKTSLLLDQRQYGTHQEIDKMELFFREDPIGYIAGALINVEPVDGATHLFKVKTGDYTVTSVQPNTIVTPKVELPAKVGLTTEQLQAKYRGTWLKCGGNRKYLIDDVLLENGYPTFVLWKNHSSEYFTETADDGSTSMATSQKIDEVTSEEVKDGGLLFSVQERTEKPDQWTGPLAKTVDIINLSPQKIVANGSARSILSCQALGDSNSTKLVLDEAVATIPESISFTHKVAAFVRGSNSIGLQGNFSEGVQSLIASGTEITLCNSIVDGYGSPTNNGTYIVKSVTYDIEIDSTLLTIETNGFNLKKDFPFCALEYQRSATVDKTRSNMTTLYLLGDLSEEIGVVYSEPEFWGEINDLGRPVNPDGGIAARGGIFGTGTVERKLTENVQSGKPEFAGEYKITFNQPSDELLPIHPDSVLEPGDTQKLLHPSDSDVRWLSGKVRIPVLPKANAFPEYKQLDVTGIEYTTGGALKLSVLDTSYAVEGNPSITVDEIVRPNVDINFFPGYRLYLKAEQGKMDATLIEPDADSSEKITFLSARTVNNLGRDVELVSQLCNPMAIRAPKILPPVQPDKPRGASFATRPDIYMRSTYTMDIAFPKEPWAFLVMRGNGNAILSTLYSKETFTEVKAKLADVAPEFIGTVWDSLFNETQRLFNDATLRASGEAFEEVLFDDGTTFRFPVPDNSNYVSASGTFLLKEEKQELLKPFVSGQVVEYYNDPVTGVRYDWYQLLRQAIWASFIGITEKPIMAEFIREGIETRNSKPVLMKENGQPLGTDDPEYDPTPMIVRPNLSVSEFRFTDYKLDGASNDVYFYCAMGMGNNFKTSAPGGVIGPVRMVNTAPAKAPVIRKMISQVANPNSGTTPEVHISVANYPESEKIVSYGLYRCGTPEQSKLLRNMNLIKTISVKQEVNESDNSTLIVDDFSSDDFIPYGDNLVYRVVGFREIVNEDGDLELVPSFPSQVLISNIVDAYVPEAPICRIEGTYSVARKKYSDVTLSWDKSVHNGRYFIYEMTDAGTWDLIETVEDNRLSISHSLQDEESKPREFNMVNDEGQRTYRFKVDVENSSGMRNRSSYEVTLKGTN